MFFPFSNIFSTLYLTNLVVLHNIVPLTSFVGLPLPKLVPNLIHWQQVGIITPPPKVGTQFAVYILTDFMVSSSSPITSFTPGDTFTEARSARGWVVTETGGSLLPDDPASEAASPSPPDTAICDPRTGADHYNSIKFYHVNPHQKWQIFCSTIKYVFN